MSTSEGSPKIFISWSQDVSHAVALALRDWIRKVFQSADVFVSSEDIDLGTLGMEKIHKELVGSQVGLIVVTKGNQERQWLNFEAGVLFSQLDKDSGRVIPLLVDLPQGDFKGPMTLLQYAELQEDSVRKIVTSIARALKVEADLDNRVEIAEVFWPKLNSAIEAAIQSHAESPQQPARAQKDKLDELLTLVRGLYSLPPSRTLLTDAPSMFERYEAAVRFADNRIRAGLAVSDVSASLSDLFDVPTDMSLTIAQKAYKEIQDSALRRKGRLVANQVLDARGDETP